MNSSLNKKILIVLIILIPIVFIIIGMFIRPAEPGDNSEDAIRHDSEQEPDITNQSKKITLDDIKKEFTEEERKISSGFEILNTTTFRGSDGFYALIEHRYSDDADSFFRLYSMDTGEYWDLPTFGIIEIDEIISENEIVFVNKTGKWSESPKIDFPYIIRCVRDSKENEFERIIEDLYLDIETPFKFGASESDISDIKVYPDSIVIFFYVKLLAATATIPPADISYDKEKEQMIIVFDRCNAVFDLNSLSGIETNPFVRWIDVQNADNKCILKIGLKSVKKYHMKEYSKHEKLTDPVFLSLTITFKGE